MKDPLQVEKTPHDLLQVSPDATTADIDRAFVNALRRGVPYNAAKEARDILLLKPPELRYSQVLVYDEATLKSLAPSPLQEPSVLDRAHRASTARAWERQFHSRFPDLHLAHSLAVLWYWWTRYEEERFRVLIEAAQTKTRAVKLSRPKLLQAICAGDGVSCTGGNGADCPRKQCPWREDCLSSAPRPWDMWSRVISYWGMLAATPAFWREKLRLPAAEAEPFRERLLSSLRRNLLDRVDFYGARARLLAQKYRELEWALSVELESADALKKINARTKHGPLNCGPMLLGRFGRLEKLRRLVEKRIREKGENQKLCRLRDVLAPYWIVMVLIRNNKPAEALERIETLSPEERTSVHVQALRARALHLLAKQKEGVGETLEALRLWEQALACGVPPELAVEIRRAIAEASLSKATALQRSAPDEAIEILERACELAPGREKLRATLGELLARRGVKRFLEGQELLQAPSGELSQLITEADQAAARSDWDTAVKRLREALRALPKKRRSAAGPNPEALALCKAGLADLERAAELGSTHGKEQLEAGRNVLNDFSSDQRTLIRRKLSRALANRGVQKANKAIDEFNKASGAHRAAAEVLLSLASWGGSTFFCGICGGPATHTMRIPGKPPLGLCARHARELQTATTSPRASRNVVNLLRSARKDLQEALDLDPSNEHAKENLKRARKSLSEIAGEAEGAGQETGCLLQVLPLVVSLFGLAAAGPAWPGSFLLAGSLLLVGLTVGGLVRAVISA